MANGGARGGVVRRTECGKGAADPGVGPHGGEANSGTCAVLPFPPWASAGEPLQSKGGRAHGPHAAPHLGAGARRTE